MSVQLDLVGLVVDDMSASFAFYRMLGLDIPAEADSEGHVEVRLPSGLRVAWDTAEMVRSFDATWQPPSGGHRVGLAFLCSSPEEVDAVHHTLVEAGYGSHLAPWDAFWGQRYAVVIDPDGNHVDLFARIGDASE